MDISIDKIDTVVARTSASFKEAKEALEKNGGDVIDAIIYLEESKSTWTDDISDKGEDVIEKVKAVIKEGNVTKVVVKRNGKTIVSIPMTLAAIGAVLYVKAALIGLGVAYVAQCTIEIEKNNGEVIYVNKEQDASKDDLYVNSEKDDYINL